MKKVIVFGKGDLSLFVAEYFKESQNWELLCVVPDLPEPTWTASLTKWAEQNAVPVKTLNELIELNESVFDLGISCYFGRILKEDFIKKFNVLLNIHNAPLPKYRGVNPINWALKNKEKIHGVTIHKIEPGIDSGPILNQVFFTINPRLEEVEEVYIRCIQYAKILFKDTIERLDSLEFTTQNEKDASYYSKRDFELLGDRKFFRRSL